MAEKTTEQLLKQIAAEMKAQTTQGEVKKKVWEHVEKEKKSHRKFLDKNLKEPKANTKIGDSFNKGMATFFSVFTKMQLSSNDAFFKKLGDKEIAAENAFRSQTKALNTMMETMNDQRKKAGDSSFSKKERKAFTDSANSLDETINKQAKEMYKKRKDVSGETQGDVEQRRKKTQKFAERQYKAFNGIADVLKTFGSLTGLTSIFKGLEAAVTLAKVAFLKTFVGGVVFAGLMLFLDGLKKANDWFGANPDISEQFSAGLANLVGSLLGWDEEKKKRVALKIDSFFTGIENFFTDITALFTGEGTVWERMKTFATKWPLFTTVIIAFAALKFGGLLLTIAAIATAFKMLSKFRTPKLPTTTKPNVRGNVRTAPGQNGVTPGQPANRYGPNGKLLPRGQVMSKAGNIVKMGVDGKGTTNVIKKLTVTAAKTAAASSVSSTVAKTAAKSILKKIAGGTLALLVPGLGWAIGGALLADSLHDVYQLTKNTDTMKSIRGVFSGSDVGKGENANGDILGNSRQSQILRDEQRMQRGQTGNSNVAVVSNSNNSQSTSIAVKAKPEMFPPQYGSGTVAAFNY
jgi:hypothetical protein